MLHHRLRNGFLGALALCLVAQAAFAASGTWINNTAQYPAWSDPANWQDGVIPGIVPDLSSNATDVATFNSADITGPTAGGNIGTSGIWSLGGHYMGGFVCTGAASGADNLTRIGTSGYDMYLAPDGSTGAGGVSILVDSGLTSSNQTFEFSVSNIVLHNAAVGTVPSVFSIINDAPNPTTIVASTVKSDAGAATIVLGGTSAGAVFNPTALPVDTANPLSLTKTGSGTWTMDAGDVTVFAVDIQQGVFKPTSVSTSGITISGAGNVMVPFSIASGAYVDVAGGAAFGGGRKLTINTGSGNYGLILQGNGAVVNSAVAGTAGPTGAWGYGDVTYTSTGKAKLSPGSNGAGTLHMGNLNMFGYQGWGAAGSGIFWDVVSVSGSGLQAAGVGADLLDIHGTLDVQNVGARNASTAIRFGLNSGLSAPVAVAGWEPGQTYSWVIAQTTGGIVGAIPTINYGDHIFFLDGLASFTDYNALRFSSVTWGDQFSLSQSGNNLVLTYNGSAPTGTASTAGDGTFTGATSLTTKAPAGASLAGLATVSNGALATKATLTDGISSALVTLTEQWRLRTTAEQTKLGGGLISDVVNFTGLTAGDEFTLEMSYSQTELDAIWEAGSNPYLAWFDGAKWVDAGVGGYDPVAKTAWATVNHGGQFAVVPEPGTIASLFSGLIALGLFVWRKKRSA